VDLVKGCENSESVTTCTTPKASLNDALIPRVLLAALPLGGDIQITQDGESWVMRGEGRRVSVDEELWQVYGMGLLGKGRAETTGEDNFETVRLVWAAYESARQNKVIEIGKDF